MGFLTRKNRQVVVIVCSANITRSPYLAHKIKAELSKLELPEKKLPIIESAGMIATPGVSAHPVLLTVLRLRGDSLANHLSQPFDDEVAKRADLVLTAEKRHAEEILKRYPELQGRVMPLLAYGRDPGWTGDVDIPDPTGGEVEEYQQFLDLADAQAQRLRRLYTRNGGF